MKFDNYMDPRKTFGKAVTQEAEKNEILLFFLPTVVKVLDLENSLRNIQTDILNVESWNRESSEFPLDWPLQEKYLFFVQSHRL